MNADTLELEGTWEEILAHADRLRGARIRLTAWKQQDSPAIPQPNQRMLDWLTERAASPWSSEERGVLDEFTSDAEYRSVRLRHPDELP